MKGEYYLSLKCHILLILVNLDLKSQNELGDVARNQCGGIYAGFMAVQSPIE
jgi:hypothetical protein